MRQVRTHAFAAPDVGVWLWPHELAALAGLPAWYVALFVALLQRADFKTGRGRTGYGELVNALTPDQPERGPRLAAPSTQDCKRAMRRLEALRIVAVDKLRSEQIKAVEFLVGPRVAQRVPKGKPDRQPDPTRQEGKPPKLDPTTRPGLATLKPSSLPSTAPELSTGAAPTDAVREKLAAVTKRVRAGGRTRAPEGA
jgi:hypothetical protein